MKGGPRVAAAGPGSGIAGPGVSDGTKPQAISTADGISIAQASAKKGGAAVWNPSIARNTQCAELVEWAIRPRRGAPREASARGAQPDSISSPNEQKASKRKSTTRDKDRVWSLNARVDCRTRPLIISLLASRGSANFRSYFASRARY